MTKNLYEQLDLFMFAANAMARFHLYILDLEGQHIAEINFTNSSIDCN